MTDLTPLREGWDACTDRGPSDGPPLPSRTPSSYFKPLSDAVDEFAHWAQTPEDRIYTGFGSLDAAMRGIAPGELCLVIGYSHSGKTLVLLQMLKANRDKRILFFTPDEPRTLVLIKLACVIHGLSAAEIESRVADGDPSAIDLLRSTAEEHFPHLAVLDQSLALSDMERAYTEVTDHWGAAPQLVVFDYLELLQGGGEDVPSKANTIKAWGRRHNVPMLVLHQTSRSSGANGKRMTISSGSFGGEQQATHIVGVRRKRFEVEAQVHELEEKLDRSQASERLMERLEMLRWEANVHQHTVTINLVKNKRPDGGLLDDIDFEIEEGTGRLSFLPSGDLPLQYRMAARDESF
jgi:KaiC/GvpD/RAD55 family RecA-like ATPase